MRKPERITWPKSPLFYSAGAHHVPTDPVYNLLCLSRSRISGAGLSVAHCRESRVPQSSLFLLTFNKACQTLHPGEPRRTVSGIRWSLLCTRSGFPLSLVRLNLSFIYLILCIIVTVRQCLGGSRPLPFTNTPQLNLKCSVCVGCVLLANIPLFISKV